MSTYKSIKGESIVGRTSDFTSPSTEGQVFYNTTDNAFKTLISTEAFSSGANLSTPRQSMSGTGPQTANFVAGGIDPSARRAETEEYNGTGWSNGGNLNNQRYGLGIFGVQTAGVALAGRNPGNPGSPV